MTLNSWIHRCISPIEFYQNYSLRNVLFDSNVIEAKKEALYYTLMRELLTFGFPYCLQYAGNEKNVDIPISLLVGSALIIRIVYTVVADVNLRQENQRDYKFRKNILNLKNSIKNLENRLDQDSDLD